MGVGAPAQERRGLPERRFDAAPALARSRGRPRCRRSRYAHLMHVALRQACGPPGHGDRRRRRAMPRKAAARDDVRPLAGAHSHLRQLMLHTVVLAFQLHESARPHPDLSVFLLYDTLQF